MSPKSRARGSAVAAARPSPVWLPLCLLPLALAVAALADDPSPPPITDIQRVDRIVAVVDEDPIFLSDLETALAFQPDTSEDAQRLTLDRLIEERLRSHEVDRHGTARVTARQVADEVAKIEQADGPRLEALGITREDLSVLVHRQLRLLAYVEERLGALVYVSDEAIRAYHESTLREQMAGRGEDLPPLAEVHDAIAALLRERALDRRIERWTEELRQRAEIIDLLDRELPLDQLPEVVLRLESETAPSTPRQKEPWRPIP